MSAKFVTRLPGSVDKNIVSFKNFTKQLNVPFFAYADYIKCSFNTSLDRFRTYSSDNAPKHLLKIIQKYLYM